MPSILLEHLKPSIYNTVLLYIYATVLAIYYMNNMMYLLRLRMRNSIDSYDYSTLIEILSYNNVILKLKIG